MWIDLSHPLASNHHLLRVCRYQNDVVGNLLLQAGWLELIAKGGEAGFEAGC